MYELRCRHVGFDCEGVVRGTTRDDVLTQAAQHARTVHHVEITADLAEKVAAQIREAPPVPGEDGRAAGR